MRLCMGVGCLLYRGWGLQNIEKRENLAVPANGDLQELGHLQIWIVMAN